MKSLIKVKIEFIVLLFFGSLIFMAFTEDSEPWPVPSKYAKMENPTNVDKESLAVGKSLYGKHCKSCHGKTGLGDGTKAAQLETFSGDLTANIYQSQTDGEHYYKTTFGRGEMPAYEKKIPDDEDRWHIVNYMRTFK